MREENRSKVKRCRWIYPRNHNSDHRALVVKIGDKGGWDNPHISERYKIPDGVKAPPAAEQTEDEIIFQRLVDMKEKVEHRDRPDCKWI